MTVCPDCPIMLPGSLTSLKSPQAIKKPPQDTAPPGPRSQHLPGPTGCRIYHLCAPVHMQILSLPYTGVEMVLFTEWHTVGNSYMLAQ